MMVIVMTSIQYNNTNIFPLITMMSITNSSLKSTNKRLLLKVHHDDKT